MNKDVLPVIIKCLSGSLGDKVAVLLQWVKRVLHSLVNGLLYSSTHLLNLIDTSTGLMVRKDISVFFTYKENCCIYSKELKEWGSTLLGLGT